MRDFGRLENLTDPTFVHIVFQLVQKSLDTVLLSLNSFVDLGEEHEHHFFVFQSLLVFNADCVDLFLHPVLGFSHLCNLILERKDLLLFGLNDIIDVLFAFNQVHLLLLYLSNALDHVIKLSFLLLFLFIQELDMLPLLLKTLSLVFKIIFELFLFDPELLIQVSFQLQLLLIGLVV